MPSTRSVGRPEEARAVANRYLRLERPLSEFPVVFVLAAFLGTYITLSLLPAVAVGTVSGLIVRVPLIQPRGVVHLTTINDAEAVVESFVGPTPPVLAFQWGIADTITIKGDKPKYRISHLFGLRSVVMTVKCQVERVPDTKYAIELTTMVDGQPWATYTATITQDGEQTTVEYEYGADRRLGLRRLPQRLVAKQYRNEALVAQGYTVGRRDESYGF